MAVVKKPYEISLWDDRLTFVGRTPGGSTKEMVGSIEPGFEGTIIAQYYKEVKLCTIGSDTMDAPIRAVKPKFVSKISGENTLDFTVYSHYWDESSNTLKWNPLMMYLTNERKVKLKYDGKWYDFIIKNISEDSSSKAFTYTCKDLFVNELSKTGFELEFDNELENNMGTLQYLAEKILEDSDWRLKTDTETILQYIEEPLYEAYILEGDTDEDLTKPLPGGLQVKNYYGSEGYNYSATFPYGKKIYIFYDSFANKKKTLQFLYAPNQKYPVDDKNVIIGYSENTTSGVSNYVLTDVTWQGDVPYIKVGQTTYAITNGEPTFVATLRGERLIRTQKTTYDTKLKRTVSIYKKDSDDTVGTVYGYQDTDYVSAATVSSYVSNPSSFSSTTGWKVGKTNKDEAYPVLTQEIRPKLQDVGIINPSSYSGKNYLLFTPKADKQYLMNTGLTDNRSTIKNFTKDEKYILKMHGYKTPVSAGYDKNDLDVYVCEYTLENGVYTLKKKSSSYLFTVTNKDSGDERAEKTYECKCNYSLSEQAFKDTNVGIFISPKGQIPLFLRELQFYPYKTYVDENGEEQVCEPGTVVPAEAKIQYLYYSKDADYTSEENLNYLYKGTSPNENYEPFYGAPDAPQQFEKMRSITAKESNRFNLLQTLSELFQCWAQFEIEHDDSTGKIKLDNYRQKKFVTYKKYIGQDNHVGFRYGSNLKSIKRTLDSNGVISKIIVKNNANTLGTGGFCSISRAKENPTGENTIYNFDYYVGQGLINFTTLDQDLYYDGWDQVTEQWIDSAQGYIGYYTRLRKLNEAARAHTETLAGLIATIANFDATYQTYKTSADEAETDRADQEVKFRNLTGCEFAAALPEYQPYEALKHRGPTRKDDWWKSSSLAWKFYTRTGNETDGYKYTEHTDEPVQEDGIYYARLKWWDNDEALKIYNAIATDITIKNDHTDVYTNQLSLKTGEETRKQSLLDALDDIRDQKVALNKQFYKKYSRFIQEGSWIDENYYDDELYYIDALSTLYTSSRPQVKYTIDVVDLSQLDEYKHYNFALGDKTYIEDKEFFGYAYDGSNRLYREEVIVTELSIELDSPESNKITVQNYKTQFEDLFQRVVATTQQVQFSTGEYKRSAAIVQQDGTINVTTLQNSFLNNALTIQNAKDQSVIINDNGITTMNKSHPSELLRIVSGGLFISGDGGATWTAGITAGGINASCITTGQLDAETINIVMGDHAAFRWDSLGISAYKRDEAGISPGTFTRFDQFGLYGVNGIDHFDPLKYEKAGKATALEYIKANSTFGLTWNEFWLRSTGTSGYISLSSDNDFQIIRYKTTTDGKVTSQEVPIIKIGRLESGDDQYYGIQINDLDGNSVLRTDNAGELWLDKKMSVKSNEGGLVQIGQLGREEGTGGNIYKKAPKVIDATGKFKVYENGHVEAYDICLTGDAYFEGEIQATGGAIGGLSIEEWKEMVFSVRIESTAGWVLKGTGTTLTAELYYGRKKCIIEDGKWTNEASEDKEVYEISYQWTLGGTDMAGKTNATLDVAEDDVSATAVYGCRITVTPIETS